MVRDTGTSGVDTRRRRQHISGFLLLFGSMCKDQHGNRDECHGGENEKAHGNIGFDILNKGIRHAPHTHPQSHHHQIQSQGTPHFLAVTHDTALSFLEGNKNDMWVLLAITLLFLGGIVATAWMGSSTASEIVQKHIPMKIAPINLPIVYFAWTEPENCPTLMRAQLQFMHTHTTRPIQLHIVLTGTAASCDVIYTMLKDMFSSPSGHMTVCTLSVHLGNTDEYWGMVRIRELAETHPVVAYTHCKGVTHSPILSPDVRHLFEFVLDVDLTRLVQNECDVLCTVASPSFPWFNFYWVRSAFLLHDVEDVQMGQRRHYYESYLSEKRHPDSPAPRIYSILSEEPQNPTEACAHLARWI
jgi:hypothetical protein